MHQPKKKTFELMRDLLAGLLDVSHGGRGLFQPAGPVDRRKPETVVVLTPGGIPTTDLYLGRYLERRFETTAVYVDTLGNMPPCDAKFSQNPLIVVVRYAPRRWLQWLRRHRRKLVGVVFLMDDDMPSALRTPELPFRYALKTAWRYARTRRLLEPLCSDVWVSTRELSRRYAESSPTLVEPAYVDSTSSDTKKVVYFYHGSWAHRWEIEWLVAIVRQVQKRVPGAWFEVMGTDRVRKMFRGIPRVRVIHPMPWKDYLAYAGTVKYQVGLAPCFDTAFNRARSHSKLFDITRLGAAGIYSDVTPYADKVIHGKTGWLCANQPDKWIEALTRLLNDGDLRATLYSEARDWCDNRCFT
jgi:glycosyltransferase involved in cell wall biosynthesis